MAARARETADLDAAVEAYCELEQLDGSEPIWPQRLAECYRRLGRTNDQVAALTRAVEVYADRGHELKALAICNMILALDPRRTSIAARLAELQQTRRHGLERFRPTPMDERTTTRIGTILA